MCNSIFVLVWWCRKADGLYIRHAVLYICVVHSTAELNCPVSTNTAYKIVDHFILREWAYTHAYINILRSDVVFLLFLGHCWTFICCVKIASTFRLSAIFDFIHIVLIAVAAAFRSFSTNKSKNENKNKSLLLCPVQRCRMSRALRAFAHQYSARTLFALTNTPARARTSQKHGKIVSIFGHIDSNKNNDF